MSQSKHQSSPYFRPDDRYCLIVGNFSYQALRFMTVDKTSKETESGYPDIWENKNTINSFSDQIRSYGFSPTQIIKMKNVSCAKMRTLIADLKVKIQLNAKLGRMTLIVIYYVGHGIMLNNHNQSYIVLPDLTDPVYPLEKAIRSLSKLENSFVIGILDCEREVLKP